MSVQPVSMLMPTQQPQGPYSYDQRLQQIKRMQEMADQLYQQSTSDIPVQKYKDIQAPIAWTSILAKALSGLQSGMQDTAAKNEMAAATQADRDRVAQALQAMRGNENVQGPGLAPSTTTLNTTAPQLPGGPTPTPQQTQISLPGAAPTPVANTPPPLQDRMATIAGLGGYGPQSDLMQKYLLGQESARFEQGLQRENKLWENDLPESRAARETQQQQTDDAMRLAKYKNDLPPSMDEAEKNRIAWAQLAESKRKTNLLTGVGLTEDGKVNPLAAADVQNIKSGWMTLQNVPQNRRAAVEFLLSRDATGWSPKAITQYTMGSKKITDSYIKHPTYQLFAGSAPMLARIDAAQKGGAVSDQDLLDSITKLNTGGNAVTEAQISSILGGQTYRNKINATLSRIAGKGGILSPQDRVEIRDLAHEVFEKYKAGFRPLYNEVTGKLRGANIPETFWTIPNLESLSDQYLSATGAGPSVVGGMSKENGGPTISASDAQAELERRRRERGGK